MAPGNFWGHFFLLFYFIEVKSQSSVPTGYNVNVIVTELVLTATTLNYPLGSSESHFNKSVIYFGPD